MSARLQACVGAALCLLLASTAAVAQAPAPGAGNIDERVRQQLRVPGEREQAEALMTGDADLLLLRRTQLFNAHGSLDLNTTSNAYLAPSDKVSDQYAQLQAGVGFATRVNDKLDLFADLSIVGVRYSGEDSLNYNAASGVVGAGSKFGRFNVTLLYQPSMVFSSDFGDRQLTSHRLRLAAAMPFELRGFTVQPDLHAERAITRPTDYSAWSGGAALTVSRPISKSVPAFVYANVGYDRRVFDDYFTAFLGLKRKDDSVNAGAGAIWRSAAWGEVRASYNFGHNASTSDVSGYTLHSGTLGVSATLRF